MFHNSRPHNSLRKAGKGKRHGTAHGNDTEMQSMRLSIRLAGGTISALLLLAGCAAPGAQHGQGMKQPQASTPAPAHAEMEAWRLDELTQRDQPAILLRNSQGIHAAVETRLLQDILATGERILRVAGNGPAPVFVVTASGTVNAFAFFNGEQPAIAISLGMVRLMGTDQDAWAALFGHELAHLRLEHLRGSQDRREKAEIAGSIAGVVLSVIRLPFASVAADASMLLADRAYSRDDEREADRIGLEYMRRAGFAETGAISLQQRLLTVSSGTAIPFLSTHPGGEERIENLRQLIQSGN
jgi:predicted Zn-dependent protease